jgi:ribosome-binding protein aMBF1 (putative translation factor)
MGPEMPDNKFQPPYPFSTHIGTACCEQSRTFTDLAEKLKMNVLDLMRQCNGHAPPSKALVKGLAKELDINESFLEELAEEVRKDLPALPI